MRAVAAVLICLASSFAASADHCATWTTTPADLSAVGYHIDVEYCPSDMCLTSVWVYEESNGIAGLQRGDEVVDDTCHGMIESDTVIF